MIIKQAKPGDVEKIMVLWKEFMEEHDKLILNKNPRMKPYLARKKNAAKTFRNFIRKNIRSKNSIVHIAEVNGKPAGYSLVIIKDNIAIFNIEKLGYISDLFVKKDYRGMGISSKFMDAAIRFVKDKKIKYISLVVKKDNKLAHSIYKKWDFLDYQIEMRKSI